MTPESQKIWFFINFCLQNASLGVPWPPFWPPSAPLWPSLVPLWASLGPLFGHLASLWQCLGTPWSKFWPFGTPKSPPRLIFNRISPNFMIFDNFSQIFHEFCIDFYIIRLKFLLISLSKSASIFCMFLQNLQKKNKNSKKSAKISKDYEFWGRRTFKICAFT